MHFQLRRPHCVDRPSPIKAAVTELCAVSRRIRPLNILSSPGILPDGVEAPMTIPAKLALVAGLTVPFFGLIATVYLFWRSWVGPTELCLFAFFYAYTVLGMTVGFHRLFTHRSFETGRVMKFLLAVGGTMCL